MVEAEDLVQKRRRHQIGLKFKALAGPSICLEAGRLVNPGLNDLWGLGGASSLPDCLFSKGRRCERDQLGLRGEWQSIFLGISHSAAQSAVGNTCSQMLTWSGLGCGHEVRRWQVQHMFLASSVR